MTDYGVIPEGFRRKTEDEIISELEADEIATISDDLDVSTESPVGQLNGIYGRQLGIAWETLETCYNGFDADASEGRLLETLARLTGTVRVGSTASQVDLICQLTNGTTLVAGKSYAANNDEPDVRWTPLEDFTAQGDGFSTVRFVCELTGPQEGPAGEITVIATPTVGWLSVFNPHDAALGKDIDTDPILRARRLAELSAIGNTTVNAIFSKVSRAFAAQLENLLVNENDTDVLTAGLPPHAVEVIVFDGDVPAIDNDALAQVIYDSKGAGIQAYGNTAGFAEAVVNGIATLKVVGFSRAERLDVYVEIDLGVRNDYAGDSTLKTKVAEEANLRFGPGRVITASPIASFAFDVQGVEKVTGVRIGLGPNPQVESDIPVTFRQIGRFDSSRIKVTTVYQGGTIITSLAYPMTADDTAVHLLSYVGLPVPPFRILVGAEMMTVTAANWTGTPFLLVSRGIDGSTPVAHLIYEPVTIYL